MMKPEYIQVASAVVSALTVGLGVANLGYSFRRLKQKIEARRHLINRLSHNDHFVGVANEFLKRSQKRVIERNPLRGISERTFIAPSKEEMAKLKQLIEAELGAVPSTERRLVREGLRQPSIKGRQRYVTELAGSAVRAARGVAVG